MSLGTAGEAVSASANVAPAGDPPALSGVELPPAIPESLVAIGIGSVATVLVLVRLISIPDTFFFASRGVGIWISLVCAIGIIVAGLLEASEEL